MKWAAILTGCLITATSTGCWRPYYGHNYAQPAYSAAPVYGSPPVIQQQVPVVQQQPQIIQQPQVIQNPCQPVYQPQACCY